MNSYLKQDVESQGMRSLFCGGKFIEFFLLIKVLVKVLFSLLVVRKKNI